MTNCTYRAKKIFPELCARRVPSPRFRIRSGATKQSTNQAWSYYEYLTPNVTYDILCDLTQQLGDVTRSRVLKLFTGLPVSIFDVHRFSILALTKRRLPSLIARQEAFLWQPIYATPVVDVTQYYNQV